MTQAWAWLTGPLRAAYTPTGRRQRLLGWLLITLFALTLVTIFVVRFGAPFSSMRGVHYIRFILCLDASLLTAYLLNAAGRYHLSAGLAVATAAAGPWGSVLIDPAVLRGDFVPLAYATLSVILCSILFAPRITLALAVLQFAGYAAVAIADRASASLNWPSLFLLMFFASALSILSSAVSRDNLADLDRQARQLAQSEAALRELSVRDHLTQLFNRRYLEETLEREIRRSARAHHTIGVILFDIDQFKQVNDRWGHAAGDVLLQRVGRVAREQIRGGDIACRYGGDEFVLVLPEASRQATRQRAEALREAMKEIRAEYEGQALARITISVGIALYPQHGSHGEALIHAADQALYRAKDAGRDDVVVADRRREPLASD